MSKVYNVLFLCTANSARSVLSEGLLNVLGKGRFMAFSAGSQPSGTVSPHAIELLQQIGYDTSALHSKSWEVFDQPDAPAMDIVITVCDNAKGETCPIWPGHPITAHWGYEDPQTASDEEKHAAFTRVLLQIKQRIELLVSLPEDKIAHLASIHAIGEHKVD
ncbi:arsenate reductase ArsC [Andreprevotia sp. IGB-42]|uniref:arsenate reductase ArsC n=1 Tax=Andreprevotia sp. IGB-42 TaxID=2497473 RepID=UPI0013583F1D|nr:arsenate reductase ArsC [Andreprevotia sp. IGB-42]